MDNNMINIDDLFRQRLSGAEEKEKAGAWLRMNELLDNKMPREATNWRRMLGYTAGLLLLASATVGSYEVMHSYRGTGQELMNSSASTGTAATKAPSDKQIASNSLDNNNLTKNTSSIIKEKNSVALNGQAHKTHNIAPKRKDAHNDVLTPASSIISNSLSAASSSNTSGKIAKTGKTFVKTEDVLASATAEDKPLKKARIAKQAKPTTMLAAHSTAAHKAVILPASTNTNIGVNKNALDIKHVAHTINANTLGIKPASSLAGVAKMQAVQQEEPIVKKETMDKLQVTERFVYDPKAKRGVYHFDTISRDKVSLLSSEKQSGTELAMNTEAKQTEQTLLPNAALNSGSLTAVKKDDAAKATSKRSGDLSFLDHFNAMIDNFKYNFKHIQFTPGVSAGINATFFGPYNLKGFQMGLSGSIALNENLSLMTELKYFNRLNSNIVSDDYATYINPPLSANPVKYAYQHYFEFSNIHSFEMPVSLRYTIRQFIIFGGASLAYNLAINANEVTSAYPTVSAVSEPGVSSQPKLSASDFSSRLGLAYHCGIGYQCTKNLQVDLGMTQNFWDNANTAGTKLLSNDFYKQPSLQISIGYQFVRELQMIRR